MPSAVAGRKRTQCGRTVSSRTFGNQTRSAPAFVSCNVFVPFGSVLTYFVTYCCAGSPSGPTSGFAASFASGCAITSW
jgi:hypothetical protein